MAHKTDEVTEKYAAIAREYLKMKKVYRYRMKKISEIEDQHIIRVCHDWYTENHLEQEYREFEAKQLGISYTDHARTAIE